MSDPIDLAAIRAGAGRIAGAAHRTPVATCASLDRLAGRALVFKCEQLQKAGAFKMPEDAPGVKRRAVAGYGARVVPCAPTLAAREERPPRGCWPRPAGPSSIPTTTPT